MWTTTHNPLAVFVSNRHDTIMVMTGKPKYYGTKTSTDNFDRFVDDEDEMNKDFVDDEDEDDLDIPDYINEYED